MTSIAYHILAYKEPEQVARLVNRIQTDSDFICIHFDKMVGEQRVKEWKNLIEEKCPKKNIKIVSEFRCKYGSFGQVDAVLSAMRYYENCNYDYFIDLSGDSYPLKPLEVIKKELNGQNCSFMEFFKLPWKEWYKGGLNRINNRFFFIPQRSYPYVWTFSLPRLKKGLPCGLEPYGGRGNLCLLKSHVSYIIRFAEKNSSVVKFFKRIFAPDEIFFQTILLNSPLKSSIVNESKLYCDFSEGKIHPKNLTKDDFDKLEKSGKLFARKFNLDVDKDILDIIDNIIDKAPNHAGAYLIKVRGEKLLNYVKG